MKVRLLVSRAGPDYSQSKGEIIDVSKDEGFRLLNAGQAEAVTRTPAQRAEKRPAGEKGEKRGILPRRRKG